MGQIDKKGDKYIVAKLFVGAVGMFAFALFVLPPFYNLMCSWLDINSPRLNAKQPYIAEEVKVDKSRLVKVQFVTINNAGMPWEFQPKVVSVDVHPGEATRAVFYARNTTDRKMTAQAVPSIVPERAVEFFHKTECFCFTQQALEAGKDIEMPVVFIVDQALPAAIHTITLSYTLFDVTATMAQTAEAAKAN